SVLIFLEQNDPFAMSAADYARDTAVTGLDQFDRIALWGRRGAKVVDFPYVPPALTAQQGPDDGLVYCVIGNEGAGISAALFGAHLTRFFAISVRKGRDLAADPDAARQLGLLKQMDQSGKMVTALSFDRAQLFACRDLLERRASTGPGTLRE